MPDPTPASPIQLASLLYTLAFSSDPTEGLRVAGEIADMLAPALAAGEWYSKANPPSCEPVIPGNHTQPGFIDGHPIVDEFPPDPQPERLMQLHINGQFVEQFSIGLGFDSTKKMRELEAEHGPRKPGDDWVLHNWRSADFFVLNDDGSMSKRGVELPPDPPNPQPTVRAKVGETADGEDQYITVPVIESLDDPPAPADEPEQPKMGIAWDEDDLSHQLGQALARQWGKYYEAENKRLQDAENQLYSDLNKAHAENARLTERVKELDREARSSVPMAQMLQLCRLLGVPEDTINDCSLSTHAEQLKQRAEDAEAKCKALQDEGCHWADLAAELQATLDAVVEQAETCNDYSHAAGEWSRGRFSQARKTLDICQSHTPAKPTRGELLERIEKAKDVLQLERDADKAFAILNGETT